MADEPKFKEAQMDEILKSVESPPDFHKIFDRISREQEVKRPSMFGEKEDLTSVQVVDGFEDVLNGNQLGSGFWENTWGAPYQLAYALALTSHHALGNIISDIALTSGEIMRTLREQKALAGLKILDLGSGTFPSFAIAARACGAEVYSIDAEDLAHRFKDTPGHVVLDLNHADAAEALKRETGGNFDFITENVIGLTNWSPRGIKKPDLETIKKIAAPLLKKGGRLFAVERAESFQK